MDKKRMPRKDAVRDQGPVQANPSVEKFKCPCGKGWIVTEQTGFARNKRSMTTIECDACSEQYMILNEKGDNWALVPQD